MDISSAARDLRELSQITIDDKVGAGGARVPSSGDGSHTRSGGYKAGRSKGERPQFSEIQIRWHNELFAIKSFSLWMIFSHSSSFEGAWVSPSLGEL